MKYISILICLSQLTLFTASSAQAQDDITYFDVLGDLLPSDLDVIKNSLVRFFEQLNKSGTFCPAVLVLDLSECTLRTNENKVQKFITEIKAHALASQVFMNIAQSDIESMHAEQNAIQQAQQNQINLLENKLNLMESVKNQIQALQTENQELREEITGIKVEKKARSFFEKLWGES